MRRALTAACAAAALAAGCGTGETSTPSACLTPAATYLAALQAAPRAVRLAGGVPISSCLVKNQKAGDLSRVGVALVRAATELNARARRAPGSGSTVELGYLAGAVEKGAAGTSGIHTDLVRRIDAAATFSPHGGPLPAAFEAGYRRGLAAGRDSG